MTNCFNKCLTVWISFSCLVRTVCGFKRFFRNCNQCELLTCFYHSLGLVEAVSILTLIEELLEQQTIPGCEKIFDYIESRKEKLTMVRNYFIRNEMETISPLTIYHRIWRPVKEKALFFYECVTKCFVDCLKTRARYFVAGY
jgi:hypothetical protein